MTSAKTPPPTAYAALDVLLEALDAAPVGPDQPILRKPNDADHFETTLMFAIRKLQAARHHLTNVERMLQQTMEAAQKEIAGATATIDTNFQVKMSVVSSSADFAFELSAFLVAIRSGLDFLAIVAGRTIKGVDCRSMHTLEKMAEKNGLGGPILDIVKKHRTWLKALREYRDEVVHRLVMSAPATGWVVSQHGKAASATLPVVVPRHTPKRSADTRRARMMESDVPVGLMVQESHGAVTYPDGSHQVIEHDTRYEPAPGYVRIEDFMAEHLAAYDSMLADTLEALTALNFQKVIASPAAAS